MNKHDTTKLEARKQAKAALYDSKEDRRKIAIRLDEADAVYFQTMEKLNEVEEKRNKIYEEHKVADDRCNMAQEAFVKI